MSDRLRAQSIALPIFLLVIGAILVATAITFTVSLRGPPPRPAPIALHEVAAALAGRDGANPGSRRLAVTRATRPPAPRAGERRDDGRAGAIAAALAIPPDRVRGWFDESGRGPDTAIRGGFTIAVRDGARWRIARTMADTQFATWMAVTVGAMLAALVVLAGIAWWIARAISRPLGTLARAAAEARLGAAPFAPAIGGPREVRAVGDALAAMHARLAGHADERTAMLVAIAHDLGTPLSRIAYWIERLPEDARTRAAGDIEEMRAMLGDVLRFARDERAEARVTVDLGSVIDALVDDLGSAGQPVTLDGGPRALVRGDPRALRRLFANVVDNAVRYGGAARVGWSCGADGVTVRVDDDGPGFGPGPAERLFQPFVRGDPSRNRSTGGTGLGLAIVRALAEGHGGTVRLGDGDRGGRVAVTLPTV